MKRNIKSEAAAAAVAAVVEPSRVSTGYETVATYPNGGRLACQWAGETKTKTNKVRVIARGWLDPVGGDPVWAAISFVPDAPGAKVETVSGAHAALVRAFGDKFDLDFPGKITIQKEITSGELWLRYEGAPATPRKPAPRRPRPNVEVPKGTTAALLSAGLAD